MRRSWQRLSQSSLNRTGIQPCDPTSRRGFECPQHRAQAEELPANVTSGNPPCAEALVALGLVPWSQRLMGMPWRAQATNLLQLLHELNQTITALAGAAPEGNIPQGPGSSTGWRQSCRMPLSQFCSCLGVIDPLSTPSPACALTHTATARSWLCLVPASSSVLTPPGDSTSRRVTTSSGSSSSHPYPRPISGSFTAEGQSSAPSKTPYLEAINITMGFIATVLGAVVEVRLSYQHLNK